jgi:hypothetical protein
MTRSVGAVIKRAPEPATHIRCRNAGIAQERVLLGNGTDGDTRLIGRFEGNFTGQEGGEPATQQSLRQRLGAGPTSNPSMRP